MAAKTVRTFHPASWCRALVLKCLALVLKHKQDIGATEADDAVLAVCNGLADIGVVISRQVTSALVQAPSRPFTHP